MKTEMTAEKREILEYLDGEDASYSTLRQWLPAYQTPRTLMRNLNTLETQSMIKRIGAWRNEPIYSITDSGHAWLAANE